MKYRIGTAVLVGGRSTRMGQPKENVIIKGDGRTFLEKICDEVDDCYGSCIVSRYLSIRRGQAAGRTGYTNVEDEYDDIGPLGGFVSVLKRAKTDKLDAVLFIACDIIGYNKDEIGSICGVYAGEDILWARTEGKDIQPLASIYSVRALTALEKMAEAGIYRIRDAKEYADRVGFYDSNNPSAYMNLNSPSDISAFVMTDVKERKRGNYDT
ncbi:MAG TPA: hypothetical protein DIS78_00650 [Lachnospiraceae bacterium]|nr:hypothetical protein [Lachnospiraceae bacterium]